MKLAKKMLASVLALALVAALALSAFAAGTPTINLTASKAYVGETMTITVSAAGFTGTQSADLTFKYDPTVLEFVSFEAGDAGVVEGGINISDASQATCSFMFSKAATADTATLGTYTFKVLKEGTTTFVGGADSWGYDDGDIADKVTFNNATIDATVKASETVKPTVAPTAAPTAAPTEPTSSAVTTKPASSTPATGEASIAIIAGVMAIAAVAFVATRKKDEE